MTWLQAAGEKNRYGGTDMDANYMTMLRHSALLMFSAVVTAACGGSGGNSSSPPPPPPPPIGTTLDEIQVAVFTPSCATAGCHTGPIGNNLPAGMDLSNADGSFASMVGVTSQEDPSFIRVDQFNPDGSYLIRKLEGTASTGVQMPLGAAPLDQPTIDGIRAWIANGAER